MKNLLYILFISCSITIFSQNDVTVVDGNIGYRVNYYDIVEFKNKIIFSKGDTCEVFVMNNDSIVMVCNGLDTVRVSNENITVSDEAYNATTWNGSTNAATKNAVRDKIETLPSILVNGYSSDAYTTENELFDAVSPFVPNINDAILVSGTWIKTDNSVSVLHFLIRITSTRVLLSGCKVDATPPVIFRQGIDDGDNTDLGDIDIAW